MTDGIPTVTPQNTQQKPRINVQEYRNSDLVNRLLAATPPYFYSAPIGNFFFSEMLRSLVQSRNNELNNFRNHSQSIINNNINNNLINGNLNINNNSNNNINNNTNNINNNNHTGSGRRPRKRSWSNHRSIFDLNNNDNEKNLSESPLELTTTSAVKTTPHEYQKCESAKISASDTIAKYPRYETSNDIKNDYSTEMKRSTSNEKLNENALLTSQSDIKAIDTTGSPTSIPLTPTPSNSSITCQDNIPIWSTHTTHPTPPPPPPPPSTTTTSASSTPASPAVYPILYPHFDPLHFFIDLRVSGHIYDRNKNSSSPLKGDNNNSTKINNNNDYDTIGKHRHGSAFSVPPSRHDKCGSSSVASSALNLTSSILNKYEYLSPSLNPPNDEQHSRNTNYVLQNLPRIYTNLSTHNVDDKNSINSEETIDSKSDLSDMQENYIKHENGNQDNDCEHEHESNELIVDDNGKQ